MNKNKTATDEEINAFLMSKTLQHDKCRYVETLKIKRLHPNAPEIPEYATPGASGLDLRADVGVNPFDVIEIPPGKSEIISTGIKVEIPPGYEGQIRSRSGLAARHGIIVLNSPGTIDSDYRGEIRVILYNIGKTGNFSVFHRDRIAQLVITPVSRLPIQEATQLSDSLRGDGGFGHTGMK